MLVQSRSLAQHFVLPPFKSVLLWSASLAVCSLAFGLPLGLLFLALAALGSAIAQSWLPLSQSVVLLQSFVGLNLLFVLGGAIVCSLKGLRPYQVRGSKAFGPKTPMACPLTCPLRPGNPT